MSAPHANGPFDRSALKKLCLSGPEPYDPCPAPAEWRSPVEPIDAPGEPRRAPAEFSALPDASAYRVLDCPREAACGLVAARGDWEQWSCYGCEHVPAGRTLLEVGEPKGCSECDAPVPASRPGGAITCSRECGRVRALRVMRERRRDREWRPIEEYGCVVCGGPVSTVRRRRGAKTCSPECRAEQRRRYSVDYAREVKSKREQDSPRTARDRVY